MASDVDECRRCGGQLVLCGRIGNDGLAPVKCQTCCVLRWLPGEGIAYETEAPPPPKGALLP